MNTTFHVATFLLLSLKKEPEDRETKQLASHTITYNPFIKKAGKFTQVYFASKSKSSDN